MPFSKLLKDTITVSRLTAGVGVQKTYVAVSTSIKASIQPLGAEQTAMHGFAMGKGYKCFTDPVGVQAGDKIVNTVTNEEFRVQGVEAFIMTGVKPKHEQIVMVKEDS